MGHGAPSTVTASKLYCAVDELSATRGTPVVKSGPAFVTAPVNTSLLARRRGAVRRARERDLEVCVRRLGRPRRGPVGVGGVVRELRGEGLRRRRLHVDREVPAGVRRVRDRGAVGRPCRRLLAGVGIGHVDCAGTVGRHEPDVVVGADERDLRAVRAVRGIRPGRSRFRKPPSPFELIDARMQLPSNDGQRV